MGRGDFLYNDFVSRLGVTPTSCQSGMLRQAAEFITGDDADIMVVNGYAGTGKTTAIAAVIASLSDLKIPCVLLAPTGRAAKVLSAYARRPAHTIHKGIYRQKKVDAEGFGMFSLAPNKNKNTLFVVDEVSLIGIDQGAQQSAAFGTGNLLEDLISFVRNGCDCRLILIGDAAQLPPVGHQVSPALSREYMDGFGGVVYSTMTTVVRQAGESGILHNATMIREMIEECPADEFAGPLWLDIEGYDDIQRLSGGELIDAVSDAYARYGEDETIILCRSNKRAIRYNMGIRSTVQFKEERLVRGDKLMIVKNCYKFVDEVEDMDYIANGDTADLLSIGHYTERYGLHFAEARLSFPDYRDQEIVAKVCLDTLESESAALTYEQQNALYAGVSADYADLGSKKKIYDAVKDDPFYNALQLKYANAVTGHKSQGGQWKCVFIDNPFWQDELTVDDLKWLYTALTRAVEKVYLVNFKDDYFE